MERVERVQELNNEINDDLDDIFSQIEIERQKGFQEYIERCSPDNSITGSEEEYHSNTTPEPSRTPTQFNVNASEFKVSVMGHFLLYILINFNFSLRLNVIMRMGRSRINQLLRIINQDI